MCRYSLVCHSACPMCKPMEGSYEERPQRPHDHCECTIIDHHGGRDSRGRCVHKYTTAVSADFGDIEWEPHDAPYPEGQYPTQMTVECEVVILCRSGDTITVQTSISYTGARLRQLWGAQDCDEQALNDATQRALDIAKDECPSCREPQAGMV